MTKPSRYSPEERERRKALVVCNNTCARCDRTAWSLALEALMELRPKRGDPFRKELVCGPCCYEQDRRAADAAKKQRRAEKKQRRRIA